jgi:hypothetical protein
MPDTQKTEMKLFSARDLLKFAVMLHTGMASRSAGGSSALPTAVEYIGMINVILHVLQCNNAYFHLTKEQREAICPLLTHCWIPGDCSSPFSAGSLLLSPATVAAQQQALYPMFTAAAQQPQFPTLPPLYLPTMSPGFSVAAAPAPLLGPLVTAPAPAPAPAPGAAAPLLGPLVGVIPETGPLAQRFPFATAATTDYTRKKKSSKL